VGRCEQYLRSGHVDGAIFVSMSDESMLQRLHDDGVAVVSSGRPRTAQVPYVDVENRSGSHAAVAHLLRRGRRCVAAITGTSGLSAADDRLAGYMDALQEADIAIDPQLIASGRFSHDGGAEAMTELLARVPTLDAVFAANDPMAIGALTVLRGRGLAVPDDVALASFDGTTLSLDASPPITTVVQPAFLLGRALAQMALDVARGVAVSPRSLPTELVVGGTT
jgi:DNA-binding LacI/PurR family transcriptional regulator